MPNLIGWKRQNSYQNGITQTQISETKTTSKILKMSLSVPSNNHHYHERLYIDGGLFRVPTRYLFLSDHILNAGSQGIVIKAHDRATHKDVVIKKLKHLFAPDHLARRTNREFILSQIVKHENVIQLNSAFTPQDSLKDFEEFYMVTDFVRYPLKMIIERRDALFKCPEGGYKLAYVLRQILSGVRHLHQTGIVHRDLSVANIQVSEKFEIKIIDLGLARELADDAPSNIHLSSYVTTRFYRAPEIILDILYDKKVDVWSVGCIFAEILFGHPMFIADSLKIWQKITEELGTPNQDFLSRVSEPARTYAMSQPVYKAKPWNELFPDNVFPPRGTYERPITTPRAGRDLLSKMLVIDPHYRISINQALEHEFVEWPDEVDTVTPPLSKYTGSTDGVQMSENEWKTLLFGQVKQYERDHCIYGKVDAKSAHSCKICRDNKCGCAICTRLEFSIPNGLQL